MPAGDNDESDRSAILDGPWVGITGGGQLYRCLRSIGRFDFGMEGRVIQGDHYMARATYRGGQTGLSRGRHLAGSRISIWSHRNSETRGATRGYQPAVHDLRWDPAHYWR